MADSHASENFCISKTSNDEHHHEEHEKTYQKYREMLQTLPKGKGWATQNLYSYQGCWLSPVFSLNGILLLQNHFKARPSDIFLATYPKCGTTWFQALMFTIKNRSIHDFSNHPLLNTTPHECLPLLDVVVTQNNSITNLEVLPSPRLFATHFPYHLLLEPVIASGCKFVFICRSPKDVILSMWIFMKNRRPKELPPLSLEEAFESFCEGVSPYGPFWDHVLGYWKASLESPHKILFFKYENMKREPLVYLKRLAEFMGQPFSPKEEKEGVLQQIHKLCSFENLSNLEVNKTGGQHYTARNLPPNSEFFRKGQIGDWSNHLTYEMAERLDRITEEKLYGSGLSFDV